MTGRGTAIFAVILLSMASVVLADERAYIVGRGETFSQIAKKLIGKPVYSRNGSLAMLQKLNPQITNMHRIFPGQRIFLGSVNERELASAQEVQQADEPAAEPPIVEETVPLPKPTANLEPADEVLSDPVSRLGVEGGMGFFRIDGTDKVTGASATLLSDLTPKLRAHWDLDWNPEWTSRLAFSYQRYKIQDDTSRIPRTILNAEGALYGFEAGMLRSWSSRSRTGIFIGMEERLFSHAPSRSEIAMEKVGTPNVKVKQELDLVKFRKAAFGTRLTGEVLLPGRGQGYTTETGYGGETAFYLKHEMKSVALTGEVYYGLSQQNSGLATQKESRIGAMLGVSWRLGD